jgi:pyridoxal biosynthesis lyase PdxS
MINAIKAAVTIPVMAKARIGHFVEAQILEALGVDYVDESEVLTPLMRSTTSTAQLQGALLTGCR